MPTMWSTQVETQPGPRPDTPRAPGECSGGTTYQPAHTGQHAARAEDDVHTWAQSPEFHDRPGSGKHTADGLKFF
jgi:hypothetical protein